jgi:hypothetical protein
MIAQASRSVVFPRRSRIDGHFSKFEGMLAGETPSKTIITDGYPSTILVISLSENSMGQVRWRSEVSKKNDTIAFPSVPVRWALFALDFSSMVNQR